MVAIWCISRVLSAWLPFAVVSVFTFYPVYEDLQINCFLYWRSCKILWHFSKLCTLEKIWVCSLNLECDVCLFHPWFPNLSRYLLLLINDGIIIMGGRVFIDPLECAVWKVDWIITFGVLFLNCQLLINLTPSPLVSYPVEMNVLYFYSTAEYETPMKLNTNGEKYGRDIPSSRLFYFTKTLYNISI